MKVSLTRLLWVVIAEAKYFYTSSYSSYSQKLLSSIVRCQSPIPTQTRKNTSKDHYKIDQSQVIEQMALNTTLADRQTKIQSHINTANVAKMSPTLLTFFVTEAMVTFFCHHICVTSFCHHCHHGFNINYQKYKQGV